MSKVGNQMHHTQRLDGGSVKRPWENSGDGQTRTERGDEYILIQAFPDDIDTIVVRNDVTALRAP